MLSKAARDFLYWLGGPQKEDEKPFQVRRRGLGKLAIGGVALTIVFSLAPEIIDANNGIECSASTHTEIAQPNNTAWGFANEQAKKMGVSVAEYFDLVQQDNPGLEDGFSVGEEIVLRDNCNR